MQIPVIVSAEITDEIHNRVVTLRVRDSSTGHGCATDHTVRVLFSDIVLSSGMYPADNAALTEYAERALALRCNTAKCMSDISEIHLNTLNAPE